MVANLDRGRFAKLAHSTVSIIYFRRLRPRDPEFAARAKTLDRNISYAMDIRIRRGNKRRRENRTI